MEILTKLCVVFNPKFGLWELISISSFKPNFDMKIVKKSASCLFIQSVFLLMHLQEWDIDCYLILDSSQHLPHFLHHHSHPASLCVVLCWGTENKIFSRMMYWKLEGSHHRASDVFVAQQSAASVPHYCIPSSSQIVSIFKSCFHPLSDCYSSRSICN